MLWLIGKNLVFVIKSRPMFQLENMGVDGREGSQWMGYGCGRYLKEKEMFLNQPVESDYVCISSGFALLIGITFI